MIDEIRSNPYADWPGEGGWGVESIYCVWRDSIAEGLEATFIFFPEPGEGEVAASEPDEGNGWPVRGWRWAGWPSATSPAAGLVAGDG